MFFRPFQIWPLLNFHPEVIFKWRCVMHWGFTTVCFVSRFIHEWYVICCCSQLLQLALGAIQVICDTFGLILDPLEQGSQTQSVSWASWDWKQGIAGHIKKWRKKFELMFNVLEKNIPNGLIFLLKSSYFLMFEGRIGPSCGPSV